MLDTHKAAVLAGLTALNRRPLVGLTDGQLLERVVTNRDEAAFECLVWRHGPMVLGVCRRVLNNSADADDAFQATFLVLFRQAATIQPRERVGAWLHGVAFRTAANVRRAKLRRYKHEVNAARPEQAWPSESTVELAALIDCELAKMPDKYRLPLVLCELQGQPIQETANQLGWPQGTLASRLARGRALLARRLRETGGTDLLALVAAPVITATHVQAVIVALTGATVPARVVAELVLHSLWITKMKKLMMNTILTVGLLSMVGWGLVATQGADTPTKSETPPPTPAPKAPASEPLKAKQNKIAWGPEKDGLQLGISYTSEMPDAFRAGDAVVLQVYLKNTSAKQVVASMRTFHGDYVPEIVDSNVKGEPYRLKVVAKPLDGYPVTLKYTFLPNQEVLITEERLSIHPLDKNNAQIPHRPGKYELSYQGLPVNGDTKYSTGKLRFVIAKPEVLPDDGKGFRSQTYIKAAIALQAMGKEEAIKQLKEMVNARKLPDTMTLCRMLFTARPGKEFRRPLIGATTFVGGRSNYQDWPRDPIEIVDGVPFYLITGITLGGAPESDEMYLRYCLDNCDWSAVVYTPKSVPEMYTALDKLCNDKRLGGKTGDWDFLEKQLQMPEVDAELAKLNGYWRLVQADVFGYPNTKLNADPLILFKNSVRQIFSQRGDIGKEERVRLDPTVCPKEIDFRKIDQGAEGSPNLGIYELIGNRLRIAAGADHVVEGRPKPRPTHFTKAGNAVVIWQYEREEIAWGNAIDGIRLGVALSPAKPQLGTRITFRIYAENQGTERKEFEIPDHVYHHSFCWPIVLDKEGQQPKLRMDLFPGASPPIKWTKRTLGPGSIIEVGAETWELSEREPLERNKTPLVRLKAGTYTVHFKDYQLKGLKPVTSGRLTLTVAPE